MSTAAGTLKAVMSACINQKMHSRQRASVCMSLLSSKLYSMARDLGYRPGRANLARLLHSKVPANRYRALCAAFPHAPRQNSQSSSLRAREGSLDSISAEVHLAVNTPPPPTATTKRHSPPTTQTPSHSHMHFPTRTSPHPHTITNTRAASHRSAHLQDSIQTMKFAVSPFGYPDVATRR